MKEDEGGVAEEKEAEGEREMGKVKACKRHSPLYVFCLTKPWLTFLQTYSEEKGFTFIARCVDGTEIFGHKREFSQGVEPYVGQPVSFVYEVTEKGGSAKKVSRYMQ